jgi:hypothetical protein
MDRIYEIWMAKRFLEAAHQAAHEWFAHMEAHGPRVLQAFERTRPVSASTMAANLYLTVPESDALAMACALAVRELLGKGAAQTTEDRLYRRALVDAMAQLSKNPVPYQGETVDTVRIKRPVVG